MQSTKRRLGRSSRYIPVRATSAVAVNVSISGEHLNQAQARSQSRVTRRRIIQDISPGLDLPSSYLSEMSASTFTRELGKPRAPRLAAKRGTVIVRIRSRNP
jgi:hypothetical protein